MCLVIGERQTLEAAFYEVLRYGGAREFAFYQYEYKNIFFSVRPVIAPNISFWRQMIAYESTQNGGKATVELLKGMSRPMPNVYLHKSKFLRDER